MMTDHFFVINDKLKLNTYSGINTEKRTLILSLIVVIKLMILL